MLYVIIVSGDFMIYLDYSATTPVNLEVLDSFSKACNMYPGNPNSLHKLGISAKSMIDKATNQIATIMGVKNEEIIYTSGSSESNNLAIKGICLKYQNRGKHIITTDLEHSSIYGPIDYLLTMGFEVSYVKLTAEGTVDLEHLKSLIRDDTILVTINSVNSELGIEQPVNEIGEMLKKYPKCYFHVDMTQTVGKTKINCDNLDLVSFSAHKFFGLKGIGVLIKKDKIELESLIHGGKSTTIYRSGTPALPLIVSLAKALRLATENLYKDCEYVRELNNFVRNALNKYDKVYINSPISAIPHILNISVVGIKPETLLHALEEYDVYISTQSACSSSHSESRAVYALTKDKDRASSSVRISLSKLTTKHELNEFLMAFDTCYQRLTNLR